MFCKLTFKILIGTSKLHSTSCYLLSVFYNIQETEFNYNAVLYSNFTVVSLTILR